MIVLAHPFPFDSRVFDRLRAELPDLLTPDLHGAGTPQLDVLADQVVAVLDAAGLDTAVVGGVSMGGYVALNLIARYPERVRGLILIDTKATADAPTALANRAAMADRADAGALPDPTETVRGMVSAATVDDAVLMAELSSSVADQTATDVAWNQRAMAARPDRTAALKAATVPVLVIVGADDPITPPTVAAEMAASAGQSTLSEIADAGHLAVAEQAAAVAAAIRQWMATTQGV